MILSYLPLVFFFSNPPCFAAHFFKYWRPPFFYNPLVFFSIDFSWTFTYYLSDNSTSLTPWLSKVPCACSSLSIILAYSNLYILRAKPLFFLRPFTLFSRKAFLFFLFSISFFFSNFSTCLLYLGWAYSPLIAPNTCNVLLNMEEWLSGLKH